jgi:hypothetical protein
VQLVQLDCSQQISENKRQTAIIAIIKKSMFLRNVELLKYLMQLQNTLGSSKLGPSKIRWD